MSHLDGARKTRQSSGREAKQPVPRSTLGVKVAWIRSCQPLETGHPTGPWRSDATARSGYAMTTTTTTTTKVACTDIPSMSTSMVGWLQVNDYL